MEGENKRLRKLFREKFNTYSQYLSSTDWKNLKVNFYSSLDVCECAKCKSTKNLQVHHRTYNRLGTPDEIKDLVLVCKSCHYKIHDYKNKTKTSIEKSTDFIIYGKPVKNKKNNLRQIKKKKRRKKLSKVERCLQSKKCMEAHNKRLNMINKLKSSGIQFNSKKVKTSTIKKMSDKYL